VHREMHDRLIFNNLGLEGSCSCESAL
jgi:hypothetical protein